jgi:hypothetical protein
MIPNQAEVQNQNWTNESVDFGTNHANVDQSEPSLHSVMESGSQVESVTMIVEFIDSEQKVCIRILGLKQDEQQNTDYDERVLPYIVKSTDQLQ